MPPNLAQYEPECDSAGKRLADKRILNYPYFDFGESGSDSDSDTDGDAVVDAVYDVVWITGDVAPENPYVKSGDTVTFKHVDEFTNRFRPIPVRRYKAHLSLLSCFAAYTCIRTSTTPPVSYGMFKQDQRNRHMKAALAVIEPMSFDMAHGKLDDNGCLFLRWEMNCSDGKDVRKGELGYKCKKGWAKRRVAIGGPVVELSWRERDLLRDFDRKERVIAALEVGM
ncbi:hypothetical protein VTL71DRAFT_9642 [Oculimacula yallundae]|uniref:Uncharacterized protein n=1 Tax=Oculimacula yallundae TaxID=86028 RepID=A0ABR4BRE1_9HELO